MKALSVKQPWAWAIVNGFKPIENRTQNFAFRGELLIHAGKEDAGAASFTALRICMRNAGEDPGLVPEPHDLAKGGIVGVARLIEVMRGSTSPWFEGPFGLVLADARPLRLIPYPGQLGLFDVPDTILDRSLAPSTAAQSNLFGDAGQPASRGLPRMGQEE